MNNQPNRDQNELIARLRHLIEVAEDSVNAIERGIQYGGELGELMGSVALDNLKSSADSILACRKELKRKI